MKSEILKAMGIENIDPAYIIIALLVLIFISVIISIVNICKYDKLNKKYNKFMMGKDAESLEELIYKRFEQLDKLLDENENKTNQINKIFDNLKDTYQKFGIVKYDAFHEMGGKLSFALVMLNMENTGFVINAMHSREGCYTYIKEIIKGESYIPLGEEETVALKKALGQDE